MVIKVMHIIRPADGGMKEHLISLLKNLDRSLFITAVVCPKNSLMIDKLKQLNILTYQAEISGDLNLSRDLKAIIAIKRYIADFNPHIIHTHGAKASLIGRLANSTTNGPSNVTTVHNFVLENKVSFWKKAVYRELEKLLSKNTQSYIAVSQALKNHMIDCYGISESKIETIYNGVNINSFANTNMEISKDLTFIKDNKNITIGAIARMAPQKGLTYLIKSAKLVCTKYPQAQFILVGDGPDRNNLEKLRDKLGLKKNVIFLGERKDVKDILRHLDVYVLPSISEGLSISTIEAMASSCPVVATNVGGVPEVVQHMENGILVEPANPEKMAEAICILLENQPLAQNLSAKGLYLARRKFDMSIMANRTQDLYKKLSLPHLSNVI